MSDGSKISWTDASWNPVTGCTEVSPGCDHCYAKTFAERWRGIPGHHFETGFDVTLRPERLEQPLRWKRPRRIFVNSMSDLFHDSVPDLYIEQVFDTMEQANWHTFQVLTKRHARMRSFVRARQQRNEDYARAFETNPIPERRACPAAKFARKRADNPPANIWLGDSAEDQKWADIRIPGLLDTPAAVRFVSAEPLLGPIDLGAWLGGMWKCTACGSIQGQHTGSAHCFNCGTRNWPLPILCLDWVIVGGESGPGHRPMDIAWLESIVAQCRDAGVAVWVKQDSGPRAGHQGRIPDDLWIHEFPDTYARTAA